MGKSEIRSKLFLVGCEILGCSNFLSGIATTAQTGLPGYVVRTGEARQHCGLAGLRV